MKKWYQKPIAIATAAACLLAGGAIGFSRDSLPQLHVTAEAANTYIGAAYGLQLEYEELEDGTVEITKFVSSTSTDIELPSVIDGKSVTGIAGSAFDANDIEACSNLTSIVIPNNVVSIGDYAFRGCTSLTDVMIPDSVISIGDSAFKGCTSLTNITIPDSVISIGDSVFEGCTSLISVTISDSVISMGDFVFYNCTRLTDVTISNSVTSIGISSFYNCTSLTTITIPNRVTSIKDHAFYNCTSLTDITIPDGVTSIRDNAFCDCDNLTDIYYKGTEAKWNQISIGSSAISSDVTIHYASTTSTLGSLEINKVEVTLDELQANDYEVTVPVTINNNDDGWDALAFGLSWNTNEVTYSSNIRGNLLDDAYANQNIKIDSSGLQIAPSLGGAWVAYASEMSNNSPNYVVGDGAIINITFKVNANAQLGDIYYIDSVSKSFDGMSVPIIQHSPYVSTQLASQGYIKIVDSTATATTTATTNTITTTTTTKPITTTTTKPITTTIKPITTESTTIITTIPTTTTTTEKTTTSTTESTLGSLEINKVEVALDELQANNYLVTVPVTINNNDNGWDALSFGLSWNINEITYAGNSRGQVLINAYINNVEIVGSGLQISPDASCSWVSYAVRSDSNPNYVVGDGAIINVTFKVNENAQPGDIYYIDSSSTSFDGAYVPIIQHSPEVTQLVSQGGYIKIVDSTATTTTATTNTITTTTTTKPTTTTTKPITTTTKPITTTASTTTTMESTTTTTITTVPIITTTTTTTTTEKEYTFTPGADNWGFLNSHSNFGYGNYFMLDSYYNKLVDGLDNLEKYSVDDLLESSWGGSCYGMAATSILAADGILIPSNWQDNATFLNDIDAPPSDEVKSLINYYMALQATDAIQYQTNSFLYLTEKEKLKILVNCLKDGSPTLLTFFGSYWGHAVVAYDLQYGTYSINGTAYNGKVLIYDNNDNTFDDNYCLYFNSSKGTWTIPEYDDAYQLGFITDYTSFINYHGYIDTSDIPIQSAADSFIATLQSNLLKSNYSLTKINLNQNKNTYTFSTTDPNEIRTFSDFSDSMEANNLKFAMKDASKGYALKLATTETVDLSMRYENSIFDVTGSNGNIAVFDPSGYVSLEGSDTTYNFNMIYNDGYHTTDWYSFQVDGNHVDAANMKQTENGYVLRADSLNNVTAQAYNDDATAKVTFSTDYTDVLLYEINEETIGVAVDTNGDGTYETTIAKSDDTSEDTIMYGDVNGNNLVEVSDAVEVLKYYARKAAGLNSVFSETPSENEAIFKLADVNKDGEITVQDAVLILTYYAKTASGGNPTWEELTSA